MTQKDKQSMVRGWLYPRIAHEQDVTSTLSHAGKIWVATEGSCLHGTSGWWLV